MITKEQAIAIIRKEYLCVDRDCDIERSCGKCDLMIPSKEPILEAYKMAIKALEPCEDWYDVPSNEMILERARQASKDLRKRFKEDLEQEPCDEYGNYKYHSDIELTEPNTATSMPCGDAISRQAVLDGIDTYIYKAQSTGTQDDFYSFAELVVKTLPSVNPAKTGHWIGRDASGTNFYGKCSCCGQEIQIDAWFTQNMNYCPNCGAKMIEPQERSDKE